MKRAPLFASLLAVIAIATTACQSARKPSMAAVPPPAAIPPPAVPAASATRSSAQAPPEGSAPAIARREVIRRQEQIRRMDEAALRASQAMAEDDLEGAVSGYRRAVDGLP